MIAGTLRANMPGSAACTITWGDPWGTWRMCTEMTWKPYRLLVWWSRWRSTDRLGVGWVARGLLVGPALSMRCQPRMWTPQRAEAIDCVD